MTKVSYIESLILVFVAILVAMFFYKLMRAIERRDIGSLISMGLSLLASG